MSLDAIFKPRSVALVGASSRKEKTGYKFAKAVVDCGYSGDLYFTNPTGGEVFGRTIHKSLADIGVEIDLALVQVARERIQDVLDDCARAKVKAVILYTAGFGEADAVGAQLEKDLIAFAKRTGIRVVGPNCQGIFSASVGLDLTGAGDIPSGNIGMISQSGGLGAHAWHEAATHLRTGFSTFVSIGNQADVEIHEYLDYMAQDPDTHAIVLYLEGLKPGSGRTFLKAARAAALRKPVVAIKGGQTQSGQRAANSHTGSLVGAAAVFSAALREAGVVEVHNFEDLLPVAQALTLCKPLRSDRIALVGFGGGHSTLSADALEKGGFTVPAFSQETDARLEKLLPYWAPRKNPIDLAGGYLHDLDVWLRVTRAALEEDGIGGILLYGPWASYLPELKTGSDDWTTVSRDLAALQSEYGKPIIASSHTGRGGLYQNDVLRDGGVPVFDRIDTTVQALAALRWRSEWLDRMAGEAAGAIDRSWNADAAAPPLPTGVANLTEEEAYGLLARAGIATAPYAVAASAAQAREAAARLGFPVVMKVSSREIVHKSDVHGVMVGIADEAGAEAAFHELLRRAGQSGVEATQVLVARQMSGHELIAGYVRDAHFGPIVMVGIGGVFVEVLKDVSIRLAPLSRADAKAMLTELRGAPLLLGSRNQAPSDIDAVAEILVRLGELGAAEPRIGEIDLNPVFVTPAGAHAADARVILDQTP
jgi:acetyltransferase